MSWNLEGKRVIGMYMGEFPVAGVVRLSRVKYGGVCGLIRCNAKNLTKT